MFEVQSGRKCFHFVFAQEDRYYLDSLVCFDLNRYLYYQLKKDGYQGVFFLQDLKGGCHVATEDKKSADLYSKARSRGVLEKLGKAFGAETDIENWTYHKRNLYRLSHKNETELKNQIIRLLEEPGDCYAFVVPIAVFQELYKDGISRIGLHKALEARQNSCFILLASKKANESLDYLTGEANKDKALVSSLCEELEQLARETEKEIIPVFERLRIQLGPCYHVWNQLEKEEIRRMFLHGIWFEAWDMDRDCLQQYVDFSYAWYRSSVLAQQYPGVLPANEWGTIAELEKFLAQPQNLEGLRRAIADIMDKAEQGVSLDHVLRARYRIEELKPLREPMLEETPSQRWLNQIKFEALLPKLDEAEESALTEQYYSLKKELQIPRSNGRQLEAEAQFWAKKFEEIRRGGYYDPASVKRVLNMMEYAICRQVPQEPVFRNEIDKYRLVIETSIELGKMRREIGKREVQAEEKRAEYVRELARISRTEIASGQTRNKIMQMVAVPEPVSKDVLAEHAKKVHLVNLKRNIEQTEQLLGMDRVKLESMQKTVDAIELTLGSYTRDGLKEALTKILCEETERKKEQAIREARLENELNEAMDIYEITQEETQKQVLKAGDSQTADYDAEYEQIVSEALSGTCREDKRECLILE